MIDRLFYIIYNKYYKHGEYKNDIPPLTVFGLFLAAITALLLLMYIIIKLAIDPTSYQQHRVKFPFGLIFIIGLLITYFSFYYRQRYKIIYEKYKDNLNYDSLQIRIFAFVIVYLTIFSPFIYGVLWIRIYQGMWVSIG